MTPEDDRKYVDDVPREIQDLLYEGRKIEAIKLARKSADISLKDAKERIERVEADLRERNPHAFGTGAGGGCAGSARAALFLLPALAVAAMLMLALSCSRSGSEAADEPANAVVPTVGYSYPELDRGQVAIMDGLVRRAEERKWEVLPANANFSATQQAEQIEYFIRRGVDAVVAVPVDSEGIAASVKACKDAGIPFYTVDRAPVGVEIEMAVLADNFMAGEQCGRALVRLLKERHGEARGTVIELQGDLRQNVTKLRGAGFHSVVDEHPGIEVIQRPTAWQPPRVEAALNELLPERKVDAIYMHSDAVGLTVTLDCLREHNVLAARGEPDHVFLIGVDGAPAMLRAIRDGRADFAASQPLTDFGIVVEWIESGLAGEPVQEGEVRREGAPWSPAQIERTEIGWTLLLATTPVTPEKADDENLWGNQ